MHVPSSLGWLGGRVSWPGRVTRSLMQQHTRMARHLSILRVSVRKDWDVARQTGMRLLPKVLPPQRDGMRNAVQHVNGVGGY